MSWSSPTTLGSGFGATGAASQTLSGITAAAGTFVIVTGAFQGSSTITGFTFSDSSANAWTVHSEVVNGTAGHYAFIAYSILTNALSGGSLTITRTPSAAGNINSWAMGAVSFTGNAPSSPEDAGVLAVATGSSATPSVTGNAAAQAGDLLIAVCAVNPASTTTYTEDTAGGWTNLFTLFPNTFLLLGAAYRIDAGSSGISHSPTLNKSQAWAEIQIGFSPGAASLAISAHGIAAANGSGATSAKTALSAIATAKAGARSNPSLSLALAARALATAFGRTIAAFSTSLFARGDAAATAKANFSAEIPVVVDPEHLLDAPALVRNLAASVAVRVLKAVTILRSLKVP